MQFEQRDSFACFNSRSREGSDELQAEALIVIDVSIHAPARGATCTRCFVAIAQDCFNSRSREGSDMSFAGWHLTVGFQFTLPRGERLASPRR